MELELHHDTGSWAAVNPGDRMEQMEGETSSEGDWGNFAGDTLTVGNGNQCPDEGYILCHQSLDMHSPKQSPTAPTPQQGH